MFLELYKTPVVFCYEFMKNPLISLLVKMCLGSKNFVFVLIAIFISYLTIFAHFCRCQGVNVIVKLCRVESEIFVLGS
jgi:hypothetical protein